MPLGSSLEGTLAEMNNQQIISLITACLGSQPSLYRQLRPWVTSSSLPGLQWRSIMRMEQGWTQPQAYSNVDGPSTCRDRESIQPCSWLIAITCHQSSKCASNCYRVQAVLVCREVLIIIIILIKFKYWQQFVGGKKTIEAQQGQNVAIHGKTEQIERCD